MINKNDIPMKNVALDTIAAKKSAMEKGVKSYKKATPLKDNTIKMIIEDVNKKSKEMPIR